MKTYVVQQTFRGMATFLVKAENGKEALDKVNKRLIDPDVECVDRDATEVFKAVFVRLDKPKKRS